MSIAPPQRSLKATLDEIRDAHAALVAARERLIAALRAVTAERGWVEQPASLGMLQAFENEAEILRDQALEDPTASASGIVVGELTERELSDLIRMGELALDRAAA